MSTPASTEGTPTARLQAALVQQIQLTHTHTQQLQEASTAMQGLQAQVQPLQASVDALSVQQGALANQQTEILNQLQALMAALAPVDQPAPAAAPPVDAVPVIPPAVVPVSRETVLASPRPFDGDFESCTTFIMQCELVFMHQSSMFPSDASRMAYVTNLLTGRAAQWATSSWSMGASFCANYSDFIAELRKVFHHPTSGQDSDARLSGIQQGGASVTDYSVDFRLAAAESGWNDRALRAAFRRGLSEAVKDQLATLEEPSTLDGLIALSVRIDGRNRERRRERGLRASKAASPASTPSAPSPSVLFSSPPPVAAEERMEVGRTRLTPAERESRFKAGLCFYCGQKNHRLRDCPSRPKD